MIWSPKEGFPSSRRQWNTLPITFLRWILDGQCNVPENVKTSERIMKNLWWNYHAVAGGTHLWHHTFWEHSRILHNASAEKTALNELFAPEVQNEVLKYHTPKSSLLISVFDLDSPNTVSMKQRSQNCGFLINNKAREQKVRLVSSCSVVRHIPIEWFDCSQ